MRDWIYLILIALVLIVPFALRPRGSNESGAGSSSGRVGRLIIVTPNNQNICSEFGRAFSQWHQRVYGQAVEVDWRNMGGTPDIRHYLQTTFAAQADGPNSYKPGATAGIDIAWGGGDYFFNRELKPLGILVPMSGDTNLTEAIRQAFPAKSLAGVNLLDVSFDKNGKALDPQWVGTCLSSFGIVYNPDLYSAQALNLPPPKSWADMADPRLSGFVALADPSRSGSAAVAYMMVLQRAMADAEQEFYAKYPELKPIKAGKPSTQPMPRLANAIEIASKAVEKLAKQPEYNAALQRGFAKGMGRLLLIAANARYFTDSSTQVPADVASGEAAVGTAIDFYGRVYEDSVGLQRCRFVLPRAETAITPDPGAILLGAPHPELARHFFEFVLSPEGQKLWDLRVGAPGGPKQWALRRMPLRRDIYGQGPADRADWCDPNIDPFKDAGDFNQRGQWMGPFSVLQYLWATAWIDTRDDLLPAYVAVRAVRNPDQRQALIDELTQLPAGIDWAGLNALADEMSARGEKHEDVSIWRTELRIKWAGQFAEHYREVGSKARKINDAEMRSERSDADHVQIVDYH